MGNMNTRIDEHFEAQEEDLPTDLRCAHCGTGITRHVVRLYLDGQPVIDQNGRPVDYLTLDDATYVARNWRAYGGGRSLRDLSDKELNEMTRTVAVLDSER